jgi:hypothetical protein
VRPLLGSRGLIRYMYMYVEEVAESRNATQR